MRVTILTKIGRRPSVPIGELSDPRIAGRGRRIDLVSEVEADESVLIAASQMACRGQNERAR